MEGRVGRWMEGKIEGGWKEGRKGGVRKDGRKNESGVDEKKRIGCNGWEKGGMGGGGWNGGKKVGMGGKRVEWVKEGWNAGRKDELHPKFSECLTETMKIV